MSAYILPALFVILIIVSAVKCVKVYDCFLDGGKESLSLVKTVFPYIGAIFISIELLKSSGLSSLIAHALSTPLSYLGIPKEIAELLLFVPLSGNGTIALLESIISTYGVDSYVAKCASVIAGGSETIFYISAVYMSKSDVKRLGCAIPVSLFCTLLGTVIACLLCRFI
ncbi:MAG: hypothetical protein MJ193_03970 [Clostridia bacterium]|nr:hypothetical protein [Clostridia bacterium]